MPELIIMIKRSIVLVRHGKPEIEDGVPSADWKLSAQGRDAAAALGERLREFRFAQIASSPEPKAIGTAEAVASRLGLQVAIDEGLAEHARRSVGFLPRKEVEDGIAALFAHPDRLVFGDETADACFARFQQALERQRVEGTDDIIVVTHGTILSIYVSRICGIDPMPFWRGLALPTAIVLTGAQMHVIDGSPR
jgi:broad specificity phosphatase PhoE